MRSILFFDKELSTCVPSQTMIDLALDRTVALMHRGDEADAVVRRVLQTPCTEPTVIAARQAVLRDFLDTPEAIDKLTDLCRRITEEDAERRSPRYRMAHAAHGTDLSGHLLVVQDDGEWLLEILQQYARLARFLDSIAPSSPPLCALREELNAIVADDAYARLCDETAALTVMSTRDTSYAIRAELTDDLRHITYRVVCVGERIRLHKVLKEPEQIVRLDHAGQLYCEQVVITALRSLHDCLTQAARLLAAPFAALREELVFYDFGVRYCRLLDDKRVPIVWPTVTADGETVYKGLGDLYLTLHDAKLPIPNDYTAAPLVLITGANNSGKTVLMRAIGTAQLFAQAGLPLPAKEARVRVRRRVLTLYAADEKDVGRFEEECRLLSHIADTVTPDDLVLFNEPFQSTAYHEASDLLAGVFAAFAAAQIPSVLVTHIMELKDRLLAVPPCAVTAYSTTIPYLFEKQEKTRF